MAVPGTLLFSLSVFGALSAAGLDGAWGASATPGRSSSLRLLQATPEELEEARIAGDDTVFDVEGTSEPDIAPKDSPQPANTDSLPVPQPMEEEIRAPSPAQSPAEMGEQEDSAAPEEASEDDGAADSSDEAEPAAAAPQQAAYGPPGAAKRTQVNEARVPVIGLEGADKDACAAIGKVSNLGREGLSALSVRVAPLENASEADSLAPGALVWLCEAAEKWQGIIYASDEFKELGDCRVGSPVPQPEEYEGPCVHGWVEGRFLTVVAG